MLVYVSLNNHKIVRPNYYEILCCYISSIETTNEVKKIKSENKLLNYLPFSELDMTRRQIVEYILVVTRRHQL